MNATTTSLPRIYTDQHGLKHRHLTEKLIRIFFDVYNELGHGFVESVYERAFAVVKRYLFDNDKKNPCQSVSIRGEEVS